VPVTEEMTYPAFGVTVNIWVSPEATEMFPDGLIVPPAPALAVTVYVGEAAKVAVTVQLAVIGLVVKLLPLRVPPQVPSTEETW